MMNAVRHLVGKYATGKTILVLFLMTQAVYLVMLAYTIPQVEDYADDMQIFDLRAQGYGPEYAQDLLHTLGEDGRRTYLTRQLPLDFVYPGLFIVTYTLLLSYIFQRAFAAGSFMHLLVIVPMLAGIFDYLENIAIVVMLGMYPDFSSVVARISSIFSLSKTLFTTLFFVLLFVGGAKWLFEARRTRRSLTPSRR